MARSKPSRLTIGQEVNGWRIVQALDDYIHPTRRVTYQRVRVECAACGKRLSLTAAQVARTACAECAKAAPVAVTYWGSDLQERIQRQYYVRAKICLALQLAPPPFEQFAAELRAHPELLEDTPPHREAADYERRDYSPLYENGAN